MQRVYPPQSQPAQRGFARLATALRARGCGCLLMLATLSPACGVYTGSATTLHPRSFEREQGWIAVSGVPVLHQTAEHDCGPTALSMLLDYWQPKLAGTHLPLPADRQISVGQLRDVARGLGFSAFVVEGTPDDLVYELKHGRPVIVGLAKPTVNDALTHYEVVIGIHPESQRIATLDPAAGFRQNTFQGFLSEWQATGRVLLVVVPAGGGGLARR